MSRFETMDNSYVSRSESWPETPAAYAAVPLDLSYEERLEYWSESMNRIRKKLAKAARKAIEDRWIQPGEIAGKVGGVLESSLLSSQEKRMTLNQRYNNVTLGRLVNLDDDRVTRARKGEATPTDLLSILRDYSGLQSIELAKLSHPLDICATEEMDNDVLQTVINLGGTICPGNPRYKPKTMNGEIPAMTVLRKQTVGGLMAPEGEIEVIRRQAFLVRGDRDACEFDPELGQRIIIVESPKGSARARAESFRRITDKVEGYIPHLKNHENLKWLQPIATSYYAKYVGKKTN